MFTVTSDGDAEKSKSGPSVDGQLGLSGFCARQPMVQLSFGVVWFTHFTVPLPMSSAITASLVFCDGSA